MSTKAAQITPHAVLTGELLLCLHCRETHPVKFPLPLTRFTELCDAFSTLHRDCQPTPLHESQLCQNL